MKFLTDFGDSALLIPISIVIFVWLLAKQQSALPALWWGAAMATCAVAVAAMKMFFSACSRPDGLESPSGHTAFSLLVYGGMAVIFGGRQPPAWKRVVLVLAAFCFAAMIAISRIALQAHTPIETVVGYLVGTVTLALFAFGYLRTRTTDRPTASLIIILLIVVATFHGSHFSPEEGLHRLSAWLDIRSWPLNHCASG